MKDALRVLYVLPYIPSLIRVRPYQIIRALAADGHRVTVVALDDGTIKDSIGELQAICEAVHIVPHPRAVAALNCISSLATTVPLWGAYGRSLPMARLLRDLAVSGRFDVAHVEHLRAAHFARDLGRLPKVLDAVDCISALRRQVADQAGNLAEKALALGEWRKLRWYEPRAYQPYDFVAVTSRYDATCLAELATGELPPVEVIPNGVDLEYFCPVPFGGSPGMETIVFSGKMNYIANDDAALFLLKEIVPPLRSRHAGLQVILAGNGPSRRVKELAQQTGGVTVTGYVPDLRPYLGRATVAVCPIRIGVGVQNKALEAMAMGRPVVATPLVGRALTGAIECGALRLAETPEAFVEASSALLRDGREAQRAGCAARKYTEENHRWEATAAQFVEMYELARRKAR